MPSHSASRQSPGSRGRKPISIPLNLFFQKFLPYLGVSHSVCEALEGLDDERVADFISNITDRELDFRNQYLLSEIVSKFATGKTSADTYAAAVRRFDEAEDRCKETNLRFWSGAVRHSPHYPLILEARAQILSLIDSEPSLEEVSTYFDWGPGATTRLSRRRCDQAHKYSGSPESTAGNLMLAKAAICSVPLWKREVFFEDDTLSTGIKLAPGNKVVTVPKNRKTDRAIAIEPDMNIYIQKGFGGVIRNRLRRWGVNLNDQRPNQVAALLGSKDGSVATIDLSMASDTVSRALVEALLPPAWTLYLEQARSPFGFFENKRYFYAKFSSMGNGFTFELESMIFCALCRACYKFLKIDGRPIVYGDDIIVDTRAFELVLDVLNLCGFSVNPKKSFGEGPFRESCGKHFHKGVDVSPFYIRRPIKGLEELILLHNNVWRWSRGGDTIEVEEILSWLRSFAPWWMQNQGICDGHGDIAFVRGEFITPLRRRHPYQWDVVMINAWVQQSRSLSSVEIPGLLIKSLSRLEKRRERPPTWVVGDILTGIDVFPLMTGSYQRKKLLIHSP